MKMLLLSVLWICPLAAWSAEIWHMSTINQVYPTADGEVILILDTDSNYCTSANSPDYYYLSVGQNGVSADALKNMLATILAGAAAGRTFWINFDDSTAQCYINRLSLLF